MTTYAVIDMHSGGRQKLDAAVFYLEASSEEHAAVLFQEATDQDPTHVTCSCCGADYSINEYDPAEPWYWPRPGEPGARSL